MILIIIGFLIIFGYEWTYLKSKKRKKRTYWIVFGIIGASFIYCLSTVLFEHMPSPSDMIQFLFEPIQQKILG
ncbi:MULTISPECIES: hypothetical protein [Neobacillus]|uniref:Uncharacterized protein n=1 Tax=Neobacillus rhizophilus TaxID=2833579 RepID=A0A942YV75_9BACI|nr:MULTISPECIES: hypothetical protein [Neobacillus]MBS4214768.1 hypothetical protein [Neobacillus rhizophilus]